MSPSSSSSRAQRTHANQHGVVAIDDEVTLAIECKSSVSTARRQNLQQELAKLSALRPAIARSVQETGSARRVVVLAFFTFNAVLTANDRARATELGVV